MSKLYLTIFFSALILGVIFLFSEDGQSDAQRIYGECKRYSSREECYAKLFGALTAKTNLEYAYSVLLSLQNLDQQAQGCHFIAHTIAIAETEKEPSQWREVIGRSPNACTYGFIHGAMEVYFNQLPGGLTPEIAKTVCLNINRGDCPHILGHLLLVETERSIPEALEFCEAIPLEQNRRYLCYTGVFMEEQTALNLVQHGLADESALNWPARLPELETLCLGYQNIYAQACWEEIVHAFDAATGGNPKRVFELCGKAPETKSRYHCIRHAIGVTAGGPNFSFDLKKMEKICDVLPSDSPLNKSECYVQLVASFLSSVPNNAEKIVTFCSNLEAEHRGQCFAMMKIALRDLGVSSPERIQSLCSGARKDLVNLCLTASSISFAPRLEND